MNSSNIFFGKSPSKQLDSEKPWVEMRIEEKEVENIRLIWKKVKRLSWIVRDLNEFCNNRMHNSSFDQKYSTINRFR